MAAKHAEKTDETSSALRLFNFEPPVQDNETRRALHDRIAMKGSGLDDAANDAWISVRRDGSKPLQPADVLECLLGQCASVRRRVDVPLRHADIYMYCMQTQSDEHGLGTVCMRWKSPHDRPVNGHAPAAAINFSRVGMEYDTVPPQLLAPKGSPR